MNSLSLLSLLLAGLASAVPHRHGMHLHQRDDNFNLGSPFSPSPAATSSADASLPGFSAGASAAPSPSASSGNSSGFWYAQMAHNGPAGPSTPNKPGWQVYQTVQSGDGDGLQQAVDQGGHPSLWIANAPRVSSFQSVNVVSFRR